MKKFSLKQVKYITRCTINAALDMYQICDEEERQDCNRQLSHTIGLTLTGIHSNWYPEAGLYAGELMEFARLDDKIRECFFGIDAKDQKSNKFIDKLINDFVNDAFVNFEELE